MGRPCRADRIVDAIRRFDSWAEEATVYLLPEGSESLYLAIDAEGAVWFSAGCGNFIGKLTIPGQVPLHVP
ncbi:hypothetical protein ACFLSF_04995 [Candidatus Bipolaricaulota bacterium]